MIPNVCITWCRYPTKCPWCEGKYGKGDSRTKIWAGTAMVKVFFWRKGDADSRKWNMQFCYHPQCWIDQGLDYLKMNPYVAYKRGRKPELSEDKRRQRYLLVRRYHALIQRREKLKGEYPDKLLMEARIDQKIVEIMMDMTRLGGIPKRWVENLA